MLQPVLTETYARKRIVSPDKPFLLGRGLDGLYISEQERGSHVHIIGAPGSGKSKLIEYLIRHDIQRLAQGQKRACGLCFLDPSEDGDNIRKILAYCAKIGFTKVLVLDPYTLAKSKKTACINPFNEYQTYWQNSIDYLVDAFRVVYEVEDISRTSYIKTYLTALFGLFHFADLAGSDLIYFTDPFDEKIKGLVEADEKRQRIFTKAQGAINHKEFPAIWQEIAKTYLASIQFAYKNIPNFVREAGSTARRLRTLTHHPNLRYMFGHREGVDFDRLITDGWVILVNVSTGFLGTLEARLLGTIVINQIISSLKRLRQHGFAKPYYLYIDEAGQYITHTLADILAHKRKIGLRTVLAHQHLGQLDRDPLIREAILNCTQIKCAFYIENADERERVVKMLGYGGDLDRSQVAYNLSTQKTQEMVVKLGKAPPTLVRVPDTPDCMWDDSFLETLLTDKHYFTIGQIHADAKERLPHKNSKGAQSTKETDGEAARPAPVPARVSGGPQKDLPPHHEAGGKDVSRKPINI
jgi:hypothetical protein